ncbi:MAG TPA: tyrosine--tRNA ligase [Candidatus Nanoarchaeia archaeon]|nr:tyrosine--tRNA ligase [Candidatus Nanoarchaeia archaeon]
MDINEKLKLIKRNTAEIIGEEDLDNLLKEKKAPVCYLGTAPTGVPHVGYFVWGLKVADLLRAGFKVKILLADLHAALDNTPWEILEYRYEFYSKIIPLMISAMGADVSKLEFVKGSDFELKKDYIMDLYKLSSLTSVRDCHKAASEVVKLGESPKLSGYLYPLLQALDEEYLGVDMQIGGTDQRKIFVFAREKLPQIGYKKRIELMNPLIPGLIGEKMSSSVENSKISLIDSKKEIEKKVKSADFVEGNSENGVMAFLKNIIFVLKKDGGEKLIIVRPEKFGGNLEFENYEDLKKAVLEKKVHPLDLKNCVAKEIVNLLEGVEENRKELEKLYSKAYPN